MQKIAVIGGSGFIGNALIRRLADPDYSAINGDIRFPETALNAETRYCDVRKFEDCRDFIRGADAIVNLAAEHRDDILPVSRYYETNVEGARRLCEAAAAEGVKRIVFTSTVAVYGLNCPAELAEDGKVDPFNDYGLSKAKAEDVYREWLSQDDGRSLQILRPTVVFGPRNRGNVYQLLKQLHSNRFFMIGSGRNRKSMAYVENVAAALIYLLERKEPYGLFNYVDLPNWDMKRLVEHVVSKCDLKRPPRIPYSFGLAGGYAFDVLARATRRSLPISSVRVRKFCAETSFDASRLHADGFTPPWSLEAGLDHTLAVEFGAKPATAEVRGT